VFAAGRTNWIGTPDYWRAAVNRLVELIDVESQALRAIAIEDESCRQSARHACGVTRTQNQLVAA
jgi:hypothetical protein